MVCFVPQKLLSLKIAKILSYCNVINFVNNCLPCILILSWKPINCIALPGQIGHVLSKRNYLSYSKWICKFKDFFMSNAPKPILRTIVLGDSGVGKSALINRYVNQHFSGNYKPTIGTDLVSKEIFINDQLVTLQVRRKCSCFFLFSNDFLVTDIGYGRPWAFPIFGCILLSRCWLCCTSLWCDNA